MRPLSSTHTFFFFPLFFLQKNKPVNNLSNTFSGHQSITSFTNVEHGLEELNQILLSDFLTRYSYNHLVCCNMDNQCTCHLGELWVFFCVNLAGQKRRSVRCKRIDHSAFSQPEVLLCVHQWYFIGGLLELLLSIFGGWVFWFNGLMTTQLSTLGQLDYKDNSKSCFLFNWTSFWSVWQDCSESCK